jgi:hypothetical protein
MNVEDNSHDPSKYYPYDLTSIMNTRSVPAAVTCSKSGGITSDILMHAVKHLDMKLCNMIEKKTCHIFFLMAMTIIFTCNS